MRTAQILGKVVGAHCRLIGTILAFVSVLPATSIAASQKSNQLEVELKAAMNKELVEGDLQGAIEQYRGIVARAGSNRAVAAKALLQMGKCHEKLGDAEARKAYERLLSEYPDQRDIVGEARTRLAALTEPEAQKGASGITIRQLAKGPDFLMKGYVSPDGRYLTCMDKNGALAIRELATGRVRDLTNDADKSSDGVVGLISPDGRLVAYTWNKEDASWDVRVIGIDGKDRRILIPSAGGVVDLPASWSPDGTRIAIQRLAVKGKERMSIALVRVSDGSVRVLKEFDKIWPMHLFFSPNGRYLAYDFTVAEDDGKRDIALLLIDGTGTIPVVRHPADEKLLGWIPGTESVLFSSDRSGTEDAWSVQIQDGRPKDVPELIKRGLGNIDPRGFSRDGSFFYSVDSRYYALQVAPFDPSTGTLQPESSTTISGSNVIGDWSHDGELLTYISFEGPGPAGTPNSRRRVHVRNWKSGEEKKFDFEDLIISRPLWAPDGQRILAAGWKAPNSQGDGKQGLFQIDASNGRLSPLAIFAVRPQAPYLWSQDGQAIIYADRGCLWMRETASNLERELYCQPNLAPFAALSPDGRNLAFGTVDRQKGTTSVLLMPSNGGPVREFFAIPGSSPPAGLTWTPDGNQLLYVNRENGTSAFYRISLNGGNPEKLWQSRDNVLAISMHPEGRLIAFSTFVGQSEIWIMENIAGRK